MKDFIHTALEKERNSPSDKRTLGTNSSVPGWNITNTLQGNGQSLGAEGILP
jgi:hypothetical protein